MSASPTIPAAPAGLTNLPGAAPNGPVPVPGVAFPSFDGTLGALFVGSSLAMLLYGTICLQMFIYITGQRGRDDRSWLRFLIIFLFVSVSYKLTSQIFALEITRVINVACTQLIDTVHQAMLTAGMYRFLITDFMNPFALPSGGPGSGEVFIYVKESLPVIIKWLTHSGPFVLGTVNQWCMRCFAMSDILLLAYLDIVECFYGISSKGDHIYPYGDYLRLHMGHYDTHSSHRAQVLLAFFSFGTSIDLAVTGFNHRLLQVNTPDFILAYKLSASSRIVFDVFVSFALTLSLYRSRSGVGRTDHIIKLLILFTVNTNLLTTILSIAELATFLALPSATIYGGIGFLGPKTYFNTVLASLNARDYMQNKLTNENLFSNSQVPDSSTGEGSGPFSLKGFKHKGDPVADEALTFMAAQRSEGVPEESYEMSISRERE
ncbi:hypothetical protein D9756_001814 [Leucocoprinus leucothites]|uniref:DUF6534 domain-containing protein n=1 Tax=Leucocoprinus leucothites TaxID=201217 RepID=A0A8H5LI06_9AGAR|nr:hypothetical protein D9756_001814 [Leucoagaricus leucothites]